MKKIMIILLFTASVFAQNMEYAYLKNHTLTPESGKFNLNASYLLLNSTVDVLNMKESELAGTSLANIGAIGDMNGYELGSGYALTDNLFISYNYTSQSIDYVGGALNNKKHDIFLRYNLFNDEFSTMNSGVSFDIGMIRNSADTLSISDVTIVNKFLAKLKDRYFSGYEYIKIYTPNPNFIQVKEANTPEGQILLNNVPTTISLEDASDTGYYFKLLTGIHNSVTFFDLYAGYRKNSIKTFLDSSLFYESNADLISKISKYKDKRSLDRDESVIFGGFSLSTILGKVLLEMNYEYSKISRDIVNINSSNHTLDLYLGYAFNNSWFMFVGGKIMTNQFNTELPYLYNEYSASQFDKKYGWVKMGVGFRF